jgi:pimeloyl-ACP methyl ester carboxylesterase
VASLLVVALLLGVAVYVLQDSLIYHPRRYPVEPGRLLPSGGETLGFESDGARQSAYWVPGAAANSPVYFVFGGNAMLALDWLDFVAALRRRRPDFSFLLIEYPGYGANAGKPSRRTMLRSALAARERLMARLASPEPSLRERSRVLAHSIGTGVGLEFAVATRAPDLVLVAPFTTMQEEARTVVGWPLCLLLRDRWDNRARLQELSEHADRPRVRIYQGDRDEVIPVRMGRALAAGHPGWISFEEWPGVGHNDVLEPLLERLSADAGA